MGRGPLVLPPALIRPEGTARRDLVGPIAAARTGKHGISLGNNPFDEGWQSLYIQFAFPQQGTLVGLNGIEITLYVLRHHDPFGVCNRILNGVAHGVTPELLAGLGIQGKEGRLAPQVFI